MTRGREEREGGLDARAMAALQALRAAEEMPPAVEARVWARVAASVQAEEAWSSGQVRQRRREWMWAGLAVAAAAGLLLATRAGVVGPLADGEDGEAAVYSGRAAAATTAVERGRPSAADPAVAGEGGTSGHVESDMSEGTATNSEQAGGEADEPRQGSPAPNGETASGAGSPATAGGAGSRAQSAGSRASSRARGTSGSEAASGAGSQAAGSGASSLAQEAEALARAQAAIQGGRADEALSLLAGYAQRFPAGALREEHDALRALALCASSRVREGRAAAQVFLREHGSSALAERVRKGCLDG